MKRFIWIDAHNAVNLDAVASLRIEDDGRVRLLIRGVDPKDAQLFVDGDEARRFTEMLRHEITLVNEPVSQQVEVEQEDDASSAGNPVPHSWMR